MGELLALGAGFLDTWYYMILHDLQISTDTMQQWTCSWLWILWLARDLWRGESQLWSVLMPSCYEFPDRMYVICRNVWQRQISFCRNRNYQKLCETQSGFHSVAGFNMPRLSTVLICWTMAADLLKLSSAMRWWNAWSSAEVLTPDESGDSRKQPSFAPVHLRSFAHVKACEGLLKASDPSSKMKSMTQRNACGSYVIEESWHENCSQLSASDLCIDYTDWKAISGLSWFVTVCSQLEHIAACTTIKMLFWYWQVHGVLYPFVSDVQLKWQQVAASKTLMYPFGDGSIPINTIFRGMNIHLPAILMFTRGTRFWHIAIWLNWLMRRIHWDAVAPHFGPGGWQEKGMKRRCVFFYLWSFLDDLEHQLQNMSRWKFIYIDTSLSQTGLQVHQTSLWRVFKSLMRLPYTSVMMDVLMDCQLDCQAMPSIVVFRCGCRMAVAKLACFGLSDVQRGSYSWKIGWVGSCVPCLYCNIS